VFEDLSADDKKRYRDFGREMVRLAQSYAVPIVFAPPPTVTDGLINGATGAVVKWNSNYFVLTASHVLNEYEKRFRAGEKLNWQVGLLPPFDPLSRIAWRDDKGDTLLLSMSKDEALKVGSVIVSAPMEMPVPKDDELVLIAGYPKVLREVTAGGGVIGAGSLAAMFRVTDIRYGCSHCYFDCKIDEREEDLVRLNELSLPEADMDMGGLSGGPTFLIAGKFIIRPVLVGVVSDFVSQSLGCFRHLRIASLKNVKV
jgi:hypothetical protein